MSMRVAGLPDRRIRRIVADSFPLGSVGGQRDSQKRWPTRIACGSKSDTLML
jgi:hypothetical protein